jgi:uncharacterized membrane protein YbhN (UPF0104 family)
MSEPSTSRSNRRIWTTLLQVTVSAGLLIWLLNRIGLREVARQLGGMHMGWFGLAVALFLLSVVVRAARWRTLLTPLGIRASLWDLTRLYLLGFFWNSFLPTGFGGDVAKVIALGRMSGQGAESTSSVIAERAVGLFGTTLIGLAVLLIWPGLVPAPIFIAVAGVGAALLVGAWFITLDVPRWLGEHLPFTRPVVEHPKLTAFHEALRGYEPRTLLVALGASIPFTICLIFTNYLIGVALGVIVPPRYYAIFTPVVSIVNLLPLSFNGLGVREYMYDLLFTPVGVASGQAVTMALAFNLLRIGTGLLGGALSVATGARHLLQSPRAQQKGVEN